MPVEYVIQYQGILITEWLEYERTNRRATAELLLDSLNEDSPGNWRIVRRTTTITDEVLEELPSR
jgi:hypothetical protein